MRKVMLFAGTTEGRLLCEFLRQEEIKACVCVTTAYGASLLTAGKNLEICTGPMDREQMEEKMRAFVPQLVIDATHPYASRATENICAACGSLHIPCVRVLRESCPEENGTVIETDSMEQAVRVLGEMEGNIFAATGSKELEALKELPGFAERVFARILPLPEMLRKCMDTGLSGRHIICMQGPFSEEMNYAMLRETNAGILLTKESGAAGGFPEKLRAAKRAGAAVVVVKRPAQEEGYTVEEVKNLLQQEDFGTVPAGSGNTGENGADMSAGENGKENSGENSKENHRQKISIIGIGMGAAQTMTEGAKTLLSRAGLVAGAKRMLDACGVTEDCAAAEVCGMTEGCGVTEDCAAAGNRREGRRILCAWEPEKICRAIEESREAEAVVLMSGDSGFYSGTKKLLQVLEAYRDRVKGEREVLIHVEPGISSLSYFASRLQIPWEDAKIVSCHGRKENLIAAVLRHRKTFVLTEGQTGEICAGLTACALGDTLVYEGINLSGPEEAIRKYRAKEYSRPEKEGLSVLFLINEKAGRYPVTGIPEESFIRGKVPMTKSEVRAVILSKLAVKEEDIIYDLGAGTGSVSVELALAAGKGQVYAVECNAEGIDLIRQNGSKFGCANLIAVEGMAPEILKGLPAPDAVFIGGTKGRLSDILEALRQRNKPMRLCISAVTLETVCEAQRCMESFRLHNTGICQIGVTKLQPAGGLHIFRAENPIFLIWGDLTE